MIVPPLVTGGSGLLGKSLKRQRPFWRYLSSENVDLTKQDEVNEYFTRCAPPWVVHMAGKVGGIKENNRKPYDFIHTNNLINTNVISWCVQTQTPITFISSTCVYPKNPPSYPMMEDMVFSGEPEETNDGYAYAKRFATSMLRCAAKQHHLRTSTLYLCNLYGEDDHFDNEEKSHLVTSLIKRFHIAKEVGQENVELYGTGTPMRQFMYVDDAAKIIAELVDGRVCGEYNLAIEANLSVNEIAEIVKNVVGFRGTISYNGLLDGVLRKDVSSTKLRCILPHMKFVSLREGVQKTYQGYLESLYVGK